jgi:hypothetical protein
MDFQVGQNGAQCRVCRPIFLLIPRANKQASAYEVAGIAMFLALGANVFLSNQAKPIN